jgi:hypothetical protein
MLKKGKDLSNGDPKMGILKRSSFCQQFCKPWMKLKSFFLPISKSLGFQGWVVIPQNVKKILNHYTLVYIRSGFGGLKMPGGKGQK